MIPDWRKCFFTCVYDSASLFDLHIYPTGLSGAPPTPDDPSVSIGYLGTKQDLNPSCITMIDKQTSDDTIETFSVGDAIYYIKRKQ